MKTLQYETCKKLKEVLGSKEFQPEFYWLYNEEGTRESLDIKQFIAHIDVIDEFYSNNEILCPAYTVQDVLSRPFLEALGEKLGWDKLRPYAKRTETEQWRYYGEELLSAYWQSQEKFEEVLLKLIEK